MFRKFIFITKYQKSNKTPEKYLLKGNIYKRNKTVRNMGNI